MSWFLWIYLFLQTENASSLDAKFMLILALHDKDVHITLQQND